jgi:hypothetical protein
MEPESSRSNGRLKARDIIIVAAAVLVGSAAYLFSSAQTYRLGFPLDDSWIHATYARNLAAHAEWTFRPGLRSAGSTAPLWTLVLTPGFLFHIGPLWWSYALGALSLLGLAVVAESTARKLAISYDPALPWVALFIASEWHMLWAAMSGMETVLHALLVTLVLALLLKGSRRYLSLGVISGLSVWVRPDGLTLAGPALVTILFTEKTGTARTHAAISYLIGFGALLLPYLLVNLWLSGTPMPNTFYAKQAEYAVWQSQPLLNRLGVLLVQLLTGPGVLLVPGFLVSAVDGLRSRNASMLAAIVWSASYLLLYDLRLPAYQHARYLMPAMPVLFLLGIRGCLRIWESNRFGRHQWSVRFSWQVALVLLSVGFVVVGAGAYGQDVALIESEMVNVANWVALNVPPGDVVAAHDIGALGYFDTHPLVDLAGLVSPEVIPFLRDEARLSAFLKDRGARYLIAFPDVYPSWVKASRPVFSSGGRFAPAMGEQNMTVYCWDCQ